MRIYVWKYKEVTTLGGINTILTILGGIPIFVSSDFITIQQFPQSF